MEYARTSKAHSPAHVNSRIATFPSTTIHNIYASGYELQPKEKGKYLTAREIIKIELHNPKVYELIADNPP